MANKFRKICPTIQENRDINKSNEPLKPIRFTRTENLIKLKVDENLERNKNPRPLIHHQWGGGLNLYGNGRGEFTSETPNAPTIQLSSSMCSGETVAHRHRTYVSMFVALLFLTVAQWKQPQRPSVGNEFLQRNTHSIPQGSANFFWARQYMFGFGQSPKSVLQVLDFFFSFLTTFTNAKPFLVILTHRIDMLTALVWQLLLEWQLKLANQVYMHQLE